MIRSGLAKLGSRLARFGKGERGSAAAEFALVIPLFVLMTVGLYNLGFMYYAANSLHLAVERAARCTSLTPTLCPTLQTYGASQYGGPTISPTFTLVAATASKCGNRVTGTGTYRFQSGLATFNVPISASACFPAMS
jgi:Flp pilus assembly protein TadG